MTAPRNSGSATTHPRTKTAQARRIARVRNSGAAKAASNVIPLPARPRRVAAPPPATPPEPSFVRDSYASTALAEIIDRSVHATTARFTAGLSPMTVIAAYMDWAAHIAFAPGKQAQLVEKAAKKWMRLVNYAGRRAIQRDALPPCIVPLPQDRRFNDPAWQEPPYDFIYQAFLLNQQWWHNAMTGVRGV